MLDPLVIKLINKPLSILANILKKKGVAKDRVTLTGFFIGILAIPFICFHLHGLALICILLNRIMDGLDGALARITQPTDAGGFLDITLDFIFYSAIVFGFALSDPARNAVAACFLVLSFMGTGSSFLAFSIMAEKNNIKSLIYPHKSLYYLGGLTEGTETILFFVLFCLFPNYFSGLAILFALLCWITTCTRIISGYQTLKHISDEKVS